MNVFSEYHVLVLYILQHFVVEGSEISWRKCREYYGIQQNFNEKPALMSADWNDTEVDFDPYSLPITGSAFDISPESTYPLINFPVQWQDVILNNAPVYYPIGFGIEAGLGLNPAEWSYHPELFPIQLEYAEFSRARRSYASPNYPRTGTAFPSNGAERQYLPPKYFPREIQNPALQNSHQIPPMRGVPVASGGIPGKLNQLPFMAAIQYMNGNERILICGGSLISELFVLTAAHCVLDMDKVKYIRLGDLNLTSSLDDGGVQEFLVENIYFHRDYKFPLKYNDIALIKLNKPAVFTVSVRPACLEPFRVELNSKDLQAAGWGRLSYGGDLSEILQVIKISGYPGMQCQNYFVFDNGVPEGIKHDSQICAGAPGQQIDTCEGDSGGPLFYRKYTTLRNFVFMLAGVISFGQPCAMGIPGVYTRVSNFSDWIESIVWPNEF